MSATSAVTRNCVKAHELAAEQLEHEADLFNTMVEGYRSDSSRNGSLYAASRAVAAGYLTDDLSRAVKTLLLAANSHRQKVAVLWRATCPSCLCGQRQHCESCGSCPGKGRGPSCRSLDCETVHTLVSSQ